MNNARNLDRRTVLSAALAVGACSPSARAQDTPAPVEPIARPANGIIPVAFLLDQGVTVIDFCGPWEAFQDSGTNDEGFDLYTVAPTRTSVMTSGGMEIVPKHTLADAPQPRVVVIPAQSGGRQSSPTSDAKVAWLREVASNADVVMSVCTGAFLLARTGLIDGLNSTTHHDYYAQFEAAYPRVHLIRDRRFVDNGKFVSAGGLTSGVDAALHVVARYFGVERARASAAYMEHSGDGWLSGVRAPI
jgi:transcriptional regulator GlxA family with amidase domain